MKWCGQMLHSYFSMGLHAESFITVRPNQQPFLEMALSQAALAVPAHCEPALALVHHPTSLNHDYMAMTWYCGGAISQTFYEIIHGQQYYSNWISEGGLIQIKVSGLHLQRLWLNWSALGPNWISNSARDIDAVGQHHTLSGSCPVFNMGPAPSRSRSNYVTQFTNTFITTVTSITSCSNSKIRFRAHPNSRYRCLFI